MGFQYGKMFPELSQTSKQLGKSDGMYGFQFENTCLITTVHHAFKFISRMRIFNFLRAVAPVAYVTCSNKVL